MSGHDLPDMPAAATPGAAPSTPPSGSSAGAAREEDRDTRAQADRAIAEAAAAPEAPVPAKPVDADWTPENTEPRRDDAATPQDKGVLEFLGLAISAPVRDAAAPDDAAQTGE